MIGSGSYVSMLFCSLSSLYNRLVD